MFIDRWNGVPRPMARVRAGAEYLDLTMPHWYRKIRADELNVHCMDNCILGQLHGDYAAYVERKDATFKKKLVARGFMSPYTGEMLAALDYAQLTRAWRALIKERRASEQMARTSVRGMRRAQKAA